MICIRMTEVNCCGQSQIGPRGDFCRNVGGANVSAGVRDYHLLQIPTATTYAYPPNKGVVGLRSAIRMPAGS